MVQLGDEDRHARAVGGEGQAPAHLEFSGDGREALREVVWLDGKTLQIPFDAAEEQGWFGGLVLIGVEDVSIVLEDEIGDGGYDAFLVRAFD